MQDSPLEFARPMWLYAAPGIVVLAVWLMIMLDRWKARALASLVHPRFRSRLVPGHSVERLWIRRGLWLVALALLCVAAAGPRKGYELREVKQRGIDILFAIDVSRSMLAQDLSPNRLERARMGIHDFVDRLKGDRIGLIPFAGSSFALCPLTLDYEAFRESLDALDTEIIPRQGTDVASAIREADRLFTEMGNNHRILVLITDGEDFQGDALTAAKDAAKKGMVIYPVGVGDAAGVPIPLRLPDGRQDFVRDSSGQPVQTRLDESSLRQLAEATNGSYAAFGRGAEGLEQIYAEKLRLVPAEEREAKMQKVPLERFEWPLGAALFLLLMEFLFPDRRREARPQALPSVARRKGLPVALLAALFLTGTPEPSNAAEPETPPDPRVFYNTGTEAYNAGNYDEAEQALRSSLRTTDLTLQNQAYYNLGNTLYRKGAAAEGEGKVKTWESALKAYEDALALNPSDADAQYNRDLVKRKLDELKQQDPQKNQDQKDKEQQKKDEEKKDGEKKDQKSGEEEGKDGEKQEDKGEQGTGKEQGEQGEKKEGEQKEGQQGQEGEQKEGEEGKEGTGAGEKEGKEGEKKEGQAAGKDGEKKDGKDQEGQAASEGDPSKSTDEERRQPGEMNREEALRLLQALKSQERTVIPVQRDPETGQPMPRQNPNRRGRDPANSTRGKTW